MNRKKFKVGDLVQYLDAPNNDYSIGVVGEVITVQDGIYDTSIKYIYQIISSTTDRNLILSDHFLKKIK